MPIQLPDQLFETFPLSDSEKESFAAAHQQHPSISVRVNPYKSIDTFQHLPKVPWCPDGYYLAERPNFTADPLLHAGCYYVQEASSMFLDYALRHISVPDSPIVCVDLCASPGGKSTLASSLLHHESLLISNEVVPSRVGVLAENMSKWGRLNTWVSNSDPKQFGKMKNSVDLLLVDAPCSGSGLFRKMPEYAQEWDLSMVQTCALRQERILTDALPCLKEGGYLIYMTCSFCRAENEDMVDYLIENFSLESIALDPPDQWGIQITESSLHKGKGYRFFPHKLQGEGFFLACFKRLSHDESEPDIRQQKEFRNSTVLDLLSSYLEYEPLSCVQQGDQVFALDQRHHAKLNYVSKYLKLIKKGMYCGKMIRNELIPEHELAMSVHIKKEIPSVELDLNEAIRYLQRESIQPDSPKKGWLLVRYKGWPLGWIKNLGNRTNNYYPAAYRIVNKNILTP
jgi:16S rRNA C967 or C1407 C5-methylase (RsmB/RsmF family)/NOL1/NOP2/fmu family ribosome biogenesis protein